MARPLWRRRGGEWNKTPPWQVVKGAGATLTTKSTYCGLCDCGTCQCKKIAAAHREQQVAKGQPTVCRARLSKSGGHCRRTVRAGEVCERDHSKF